MSYQSWHNYGYGVCISELHFNSVRRLGKLLRKAPNYRAEVKGWLKDCGVTKPTMEDFLEFDQDYCLGMASIVSAVINEAEGIDVFACDDYDGNTYVLYAPGYPWQIKEKERDLTEEQLADMYRKYLSIVTDDTVGVDYQAPENGG